jgi:3-oxoacyl-[acyl-carrier protein] reductase
MQDLPEIGAKDSIEINVSPKTIDDFAAFSGDDNPLHMDAAYARSLGFADRVVHGMSYACLISTLIGKQLPGAGTLWASQTIRFLAPAYPGDRITLSATVIGRDERARSARLAIDATESGGRRLMEGESEVMLPRPIADRVGPVPTPAASLDSAAPVALIAGANGALGAAIARSLARDGHRVSLAGRDPTRLERLAADIGSNAICAVMDLASSDSVEAATNLTEKMLGAIKLVVHAAADPLDYTAVADLTAGVATRQFDLQAGGLLRLSQSCLAGMRARGAGQFIYIGSTAQRGAPPSRMAAYAAAKAAGVSIARSIGLENAPHGIRANIVSPHFVAGGLNAHVTDKSRKLAAAQTPMRRLAEFDEIAQVVSFLASDAGRFVNGHDLLVDGGVTMV